MEEGYDVQGYSSKVSYTSKVERKYHSHPVNAEDEIDLVMLKRPRHENDVSDSESTSGCTDLSVSTLPLTPSHSFSEISVTKCLGIEEDLSRETGIDIYDLTDLGSIPKFIQSRIDGGHESGSFLVVNVATVIDQFTRWKAELPLVEPFYAVKCNPDPVVLRLLAAMGCNFDCATMGEIDMVLNSIGEFSLGPKGTASTSIVYANPAKMKNMLEFAIDNDVRMTVFDGEDELHKIASLEGHENLQLLLRLTTDDKSSVCRFSKKFGCPVEEAPKLLELAKELNLNVAGISFHVGSGCGDPEAYSTALSHAAIVFETALQLGMPAMHIVDIGGGFPGDTSGYGGAGMPTFQDLAATIRKSIVDFSKRLNRSLDSFRFIAEPGRYFVSASTTIVTKVYSRKGGNHDFQALYVDDGVYGSFNNVVYDHATPVPLKLSSLIIPEINEKVIPSAVFGPTCDGLDQMCNLESTLLPRCDVDDWLIWDNNGAYTHTASYVFNGYTHLPKKTYCYLPNA